MAQHYVQDPHFESFLLNQSEVLVFHILQHSAEATYILSWAVEG